MRIGVTANVAGDPERLRYPVAGSWHGYPTSSLAVWVMRNGLVPQRCIQVRYVTVTRMRGHSLQLYRRSFSRVGQCGRVISLTEWEAHRAEQLDSLFLRLYVRSREDCGSLRLKSIAQLCDIRGGATGNGTEITRACDISFASVRCGDGPV